MGNRNRFCKDLCIFDAGYCLCFFRNFKKIIIRSGITHYYNKCLLFQLFILLAQKISMFYSVRSGHLITLSV
ncbi:hypothetical protein SAMN05660493_02643 [Epilithonimonas bovis DSM 19482]|uniref:Uncharacterized protein n=1 Tax=Epilithonimonas bovis DSM 19482 TaxID=1121284 RepID=A0A1U7Q0F8_9FLAO|nr:hypothetical protein SAMN05660493_02643 [Epilithonimonas bovis DSM 19482]